jgi:predicted RNA-binding protein
LVNYWFCVTNADNWNVVNTRKTWGVPTKRGKHQIETLKLGDLLVFYIIPKRIGGIFRAVTELFESNEKIFSWVDFGREELFPFRVKLESVVVAKEPISFDKIIGKLSFTKQHKPWSIMLRRAMFKISEDDFEVIRDLIEGKPSL